MKKYRVKYDFNEEIEIEADTEKEAEKMAWEMLEKQFMNVDLV